MTWSDRKYSVDQDCSGDDEACPPTFDVDDDGDRYTENQGDCNDSNADINPGETEICGDGVDQDCSGDDEDCISDKYVANGDGTVSDNETELMWQRATAPGTYNWDEAVAYCKSLTLAGYLDWRLPTREELESLFDNDYSSPAINQDFFLGTRRSWKSYYWSSSTDPKYKGTAINVSFNYTSFRAPNNDKRTTMYVRAVRSGQ